MGGGKGREGKGSYIITTKLAKMPLVQGFIFDVPFSILSFIFPYNNHNAGLNNVFSDNPTKCISCGLHMSSFNTV